LTEAKKPNKGEEIKPDDGHRQEKRTEVLYVGIKRKVIKMVSNTSEGNRKTKDTS